MNMNSVVGQMPLKWLKTLMRCLVTMWQTSELCADGLRGFDPTDNHFFQASNNFLQGKSFALKEQAKTSFSDFIASCSPRFFVVGINKLPIRWQKCINALGAYFD